MVLEAHELEQLLAEHHQSEEFTRYAVLWQSVLTRAVAACALLPDVLCAMVMYQNRGAGYRGYGRIVAHGDCDLRLDEIAEKVHYSHTSVKTAVAKGLELGYIERSEGSGVYRLTNAATSPKRGDRCCLVPETWFDAIREGSTTYVKAPRLSIACLVHMFVRSRYGYRSGCMPGYSDSTHAQFAQFLGVSERRAKDWVIRTIKAGVIERQPKGLSKKKQSYGLRLSDRMYSLLEDKSLPVLPIRNGSGWIRNREVGCGSVSNSGVAKAPASVAVQAPVHAAVPAEEIVLDFDSSQAEPQKVVAYKPSESCKWLHTPEKIAKRLADSMPEHVRNSSLYKTWASGIMLRKQRSPAQWKRACSKFNKLSQYDKDCVLDAIKRYDKLLERVVTSTNKGENLIFDTGANKFYGGFGVLGMMSPAKDFKFCGSAIPYKWSDDVFERYHGLKSGGLKSGSAPESDEFVNGPEVSPFTEFEKLRFVGFTWKGIKII
jgi:hypothetical protein